MKSLRKLAMALLILSLSLSVPNFNAHAAGGDTVVYKTKTGDCYHTSSCSSLKKSKIEISLQDAIISGLKACSKCNPPLLDGNTTAANINTANAPATYTADAAVTDTTEAMVWVTATGSKYHNKNNCGNTNPNKARQVTLSEAQSKYDACSKCFK